MGFKIRNKGLALGWKYLWRYKKDFLKVLFISMFGAVLGSMVPMIFREIIKTVEGPTLPIYTFLGLILAWVIMDQTYNWTTRFTDKNGAYVAWDASSELFIEGMQHLIKLPMSFLGDQRLGKIMQRLDRSAEYLERDIRDVVFSLLPHFTTAILGISFVMYLDWRLGSLLIVVVGFYVLAMTSKTKLILSKTRNIRKMWEECWGYLWDVVNNVKTIKSNTREAFEIERIDKNYTNPFEEEKEIEEIRTQLKFREHIIFGLGAVISLSTGAYLLNIHAIDAGALVAFLFYLNLVYKPFSQLSHNWRVVQESTIALERTAKFIEIEEEDYTSGELLTMVGQVEFKDVTFGYSKDQDEDDGTVFKNISFKVLAGETVALVGESGVGKTTLVDLISRYFSPISGSIIVDGIDVQSWNLNSLRSQIAIVPQDICLFNDTIKLNVGYGDLNKMESPSEIEKAAKSAHAHEFISSHKFKMGYDQVVGEKGVKVSTGQRQRIAIARAFLRNQSIRILILDEVTSALDSKSEKKIQESLKSLKRGKTTFIIAHRLSTIKNADKIIVLDKEGVAQIGKHDELVNTEGPYKEFVKLQNLSGII